MWKQDQSLELAVQDFVDELDPDSADAQLLAEYAGGAGEDLAEGLLEIIGLATDEARDHAKRIAAKMGLERMRNAVDCLARHLNTKRVALSQPHLCALKLRDAPS